MSFSDILLILVVAVTSTLAYSFGVAKRRRSSRALGSAMLALARCLGLFAVFVAANGAIGLLAIWFLRYVCGASITPYALDTIVWPLVSLMQATTWLLWGEYSAE